MAPKRSRRQRSTTPSSIVAQSTPASHQAALFTDANITDDTDTSSLGSQSRKRLKRKHQPSNLQLSTKGSEQDDPPKYAEVPLDTLQSNGSPSQDDNTVGRALQSYTLHSETSPPQFSPRPKSLLSNSVKCVLTVTYGGCQLGEAQRIEIDWLDKNSYKKAIDEASQQRLAEFGHVDPSIHLYRKHGVCKIFRHAIEHEDVAFVSQSISTEQEIESKTLHQVEEWVEVPQVLILRFKGKYTYDDFHLDIRWDYSGFVKPTGDDKQYTKAVKIIIDEKMRTNWNDEHYIPRIDLYEILQDDTVSRLIHCDRSISAFARDGNSTSPFDIDRFIQKVSDLGTRILAICIYAELPLICIKFMLDSGKCDASLPFGPNDMCLPREYSAAYKTFKMWQGSFVAHHFEPQANNSSRRKDCEQTLPYREIKAKVVMPICFDKTKDLVGNGSYGDVYRVTIDPDHHYFDPVS